MMNGYGMGNGGGGWIVMLVVWATLIGLIAFAIVRLVGAGGGGGTPDGGVEADAEPTPREILDRRLGYLRRGRRPARAQPGKVRAMRGRLPYVALLGGALVALVVSAAWAAAHDDGRSAWMHGRIGAATCAPPRLDGTVVGVRLMGMRGGGLMGRSMMGGGMMRLVVDRASVPAGRVSFVAQNVGGDVHELVVLPLATGLSAGARALGANDRVSETGSLGEASRPCGAGAGEGIEPGAAGWVTLDLKPGRYELVCNLRGHYRAGMYAELVVG